MRWNKCNQTTLPSTSSHNRRSGRPMLQEGKAKYPAGIGGNQGTSPTRRFHSVWDNLEELLVRNK